MKKAMRESRNEETKKKRKKRKKNNVRKGKQRDQKKPGHTHYIYTYKDAYMYIYSNTLHPRLSVSRNTS